MPTDQEYTIAELADLAGVTPRTVRYYISIGLLPAPGQVGPRTTYGQNVLQRLRLIRRLQQDHLPLGEIGTRLGAMDDAAVDEALAADESAPADSALEYIRRLRAGPVGQVGQGGQGGQADRFEFRMAAPSAPFAPVLSSAITTPAKPSPLPEPGTAQRTQWERVALSDSVELHIRRPLSRLDNKRVERLIRIGREILEGDQP